jgi:hypothetical protein
MHLVIGIARLLHQGASGEGRIGPTAKSLWISMHYLHSRSWRKTLTELQLGVYHGALPVEWTHGHAGKLYISAEEEFADLIDPSERAAKIAWLSDTTNRFVNVFRPQIGAWWREIKTGGGR